MNLFYTVLIALGETLFWAWVFSVLNIYVIINNFRVIKWK